MAYYIKPPNGRLSLSTLQLYAETRLQVLLKITRCNGKFMAIKDIVEDPAVVAQSDCLIEGSKKDLTSHFILRIACCETPEMRSVFIQGEASLFAYRVSCLSHTELTNMIRPLRRLHYSILKELSHSPCKMAYRQNHTDAVSKEMADVLSVLDHMTQHYTWEELITAYCSGKHNVEMVLPFEHVSDLVRKRLVQLQEGMAYVPSTKLAEVLKVLFELILRHGMTVAARKLPEVKEDARMRKLMARLKYTFLQSHPPVAGNNTDVVRCEEVNELQKFFPPCMVNLHASLRETHRLRHFSRIQYTLFLKELGLPLNEAIHFWRQEYSQHPKCHRDKSSNGDKGKQRNSSCEHTWEKNARRYTYNIRHLYGMEGSRINYRAHCCASLQAFSAAPGEVGGCPFSHFDRQHLLSMLAEEGIDIDSKSEILDSVESHGYTDACGIFINSKLTNTASNCCSQSAQSLKMGKKTKPVFADMTNAMKVCDVNPTTSSGHRIKTQEERINRKTVTTENGRDSKSNVCENNNNESVHFTNNHIGNNATVKTSNENVLFEKDNPISADVSKKLAANGCESFRGNSDTVVKKKSCSVHIIESPKNFLPVHKTETAEQFSFKRDYNGKLTNTESACYRDCVKEDGSYQDKEVVVSNCTCNGLMCDKTIKSCVKGDRKSQDNRGVLGNCSCNGRIPPTKLSSNKLEHCNDCNSIKVGNIKSDAVESPDLGPSQSCYNHENCPPSQMSRTNDKLNCVAEEGGKKTMKNPIVVISKPLDYYLTYKKLVSCLQENR